MVDNKKADARGGVIYDTELMKVTKQQLSGDAVGQPVKYRINVMAKKNITNVQVRERIGNQFDFVSATPSPSTSEGDYVWNLGTLQEGQSKSIDVTVRPNQRGTYRVCSVFTADPILCIPLSAGMPELVIAKTGPATMEIGETVTWDVTVTNRGDVTAPSVVLTDTLPDNFRPVGPTQFQLGDMAPGQSKTVQVSATSTGTGDFVNEATTQYQGGEPLTDDAPIRIVQSKVAIEKTGPKESYALVDERFRIKVDNTGQTTLNDVVVTDRLPPNTRVADAGGGTYTPGANDLGGTISWNVGNLSAGQSKTVSFVMTSVRPATTTNVADVQTGRGLRASDSADTLWRAVPGVRTTIYDDNDPIRIGGTTTYFVQIKNQSQLESIEAEVQIDFTDEVKPTSILTGQNGRIDGQKVTFPVVRLQPGQEVDIRIQGTGQKSGNATIDMRTSTNFRTEAILDQESTTVY